MGTLGHDVLSSIATSGAKFGVERNSWMRDIIGISSSEVEAVMLIMNGFTRLPLDRISLIHPMYEDKG
jgi:hypothetical protein